MRLGFVRLILLILCLEMWACKSDNRVNKGAGADAGTATATDTMPEIGSNDLLDILQGKWYNENDGEQVLEIQESVIRHRVNGRLVRESEIEVDSNCGMQDCQSEINEDGWCFLEKGADGSKCYLVLECNIRTLRFRDLSGDGSIVVYRRP